EINRLITADQTIRCRPLESILAPKMPIRFIARQSQPASQPVKAAFDASMDATWRYAPHVHGASVIPHIGNTYDASVADYGKRFILRTNEATGDSRDHAIGILDAADREIRGHELDHQSLVLVKARSERGYSACRSEESG